VTQKSSAEKAVCGYEDGCGGELEWKYVLEGEVEVG